MGLFFFVVFIAGDIARVKKITEFPRKESAIIFCCMVKGNHDFLILTVLEILHVKVGFHIPGILFEIIDLETQAEQQDGGLIVKVAQQVHVGGFCYKLVIK